jgi:NADH dehydrogenase
VLKLAPIMVLASPDARLQPVSVGDVAEAYVRGLTAPDASLSIYELCGPRVYTLRELVALTGALTGRPRPIIGLNRKLSYLQAAVLEMLPGKLMTRDNYFSLESDNTCAEPFPFGIKPAPIEQIAAASLPGVRQRIRYHDHAHGIVQR